MNLILTKIYLFSFQLCGIAIVAVGVVFYLKLDDLETVFDDWNVVAIPVLFIVLGAAIFIIAFFGCCGAIRESRCMTVTVSFNVQFSDIQIELTILLCQSFAVLYFPDDFVDSANYIGYHCIRLHRGHPNGCLSGLGSLVGTTI